MGYLGFYGDMNNEFSTPAIAQPSAGPSIGLGTAGAAAAGMGPTAALVAGQFLTQYMAQRAAEEENKKKMAAQAELEKGEAMMKSGQMQNSALSNLMGVYRTALMK